LMMGNSIFSTMYQIIRLSLVGLVPDHRWNAIKW
jgi:hypothetical protein